MRNLFAKLLAEKSQLTSNYSAACKEAQTQFEAEVIKEYRLLQPKAKRVTYKKAVDSLPKDQLQNLYSKHSPDQRSYTAERKRLDLSLTEAATNAEVTIGGPRLYDVVSEMAYASQGLGRVKYAQNRAEALADSIRAHGIEAEVVRVGGHNGTESSGTDFIRFEVKAHVAEDLDVQILKRRPPPSLVEQVRMMYARGVNPRVSMPHLPHSFEEEHGLDRFGGYLKGKEPK